MSAAVAAQSVSKTFAANRVHSRVAFSVAAAGGRSRRQRVYEDGALRVRFPNADELEAVIVNTAGGIAGGDRFAFDVAVCEGADLMLTTAAAEKVYRALDDAAVIDVRLALDEGATLAWLPQETILFDAGVLERSIEIDLAARARLLLAEAVVFGRTAMGEAVESGRLIDRWRVRRDGCLIFADTLRLDGAIAQKLAEPAIAAGGCAMATVLLTPADEAIVAAVRAVENPLGEVGVSTWNGLALARFVARDGEALRHDLKAVLAALGARLPRLWLN